MYGMRRPFSPLVILLAGATLSPLGACSRNIGTPPADERPPALFRVEVNADPAAGALPADGVLFVGARPAAGGPPGYAVMQETFQLPTFVDLTAENQMGPFAASVTEWVMFVRLDRDGDASTQSGEDWVGTSDRPVRAGTTAAIPVMLRPAAAPPAPWLQVRIEGPQPPSGADVFVIVREIGGRVPLAARRLVAPPAWPVDLALSEGDLLSGSPAPVGADLEVIVKVDKDGDPLTTVDGDQEGFARLDGGRAVVRLGPSAGP
jgi:hypothetical protein